MVGMAVLYLGGQGVKQDRREAFVWLNLATEYMTDKLGVRKIKAIRDEIGRTLNADDITFAKVESMMLQPTSSSVQPNEAESIGHLPDELPPAAAAPGAAPSTTLQNVPPDTAPLPQVPLLPSTSTTLPATTLPATASPVTTSTTPAPANTLPVTTPPSTPSILAKPGIPATGTNGASTGTSGDPAAVTPPPVNPVPQF
jgi:hypothetical protein